MSDNIKPSEYFVDQNENNHSLINIQLRVNKKEDVDTVISNLMKSLNKSEDITYGATINQIYFKGNDINKLTEEFKQGLIQSVTEAIRLKMF